jgi:cytochrome b
MSILSRLRAYHALLAILVLVAYFGADWHRLHVWVGYGVAAVILLRLGMALSGSPQLGLSRFYPQFSGLTLNTVATHPMISHSLLLGIAICLLGVTGTGLVMDGGRAFGLARPAAVGAMPDRPAATAPTVIGRERDESPESGEGERHEGGKGDRDSPLGEAHQLFATILMAFVATHVAYLLLFKRPLARFMIFFPARKAKP